MGEYCFYLLVFHPLDRPLQKLVLHISQLKNINLLPRQDTNHNNLIVIGTHPTYK